jgi:PLP dependent protein
MTTSTTTASIAENLSAVLARIASACERAGRDAASIRLVAVSKTMSAAVVAAAIEAGVRDLGENYVQEAEAKRAELGEGSGAARWHLIGHLQTNKVRAALETFDMIQAVDSVRLAEAISQRAQRPVPILLEVNTAREAGKFGFDPDEIGAALTAISRLANLDLRGLMTVAPAVDNASDVRPAFRALRELAAANGLQELSMGMTGDFEVAIEEGSTMLRIGRAIFGERPR